MTTDDNTGTARVNAMRHAPAELSDPGRLIAAIPHLIGFRPTCALILIALYRGNIVLTTWYDLSTAPTSERGLATAISATARHLGGAAFFACIVDDPDRANTRGRRLLHRQLIITFATQNQDIDLFGVSDLTAGARWFEYSLPDYHNGTLPDPDASPVALAAARGHVVYPSYEALAATLEPDDVDDLTRRANLIDGILNDATAQWPGDKGETRRMLAVVRRHVDQAADRVDPLTDGEIAELAIALSDLEVRDTALTFVLGEHAADAERLWTELTRKAPAPERAEPAALLAISAYIRGNATLAKLALRQAETAQPGHRLTNIIRTMITAGMPPQKVRQGVEKAAVPAAVQSQG
ncbi:DUF4192 domain-containing protein [Actinosynnema sp. CA-248983]